MPASAPRAPSPRVRFAPSPTGYLHVGGARTALFNWLFARRTGGTFVLRIEDTDTERNRDEWVEGLQSALRWLDLGWDEGPYFQSQRASLYDDAAQKLLAGGVAYYCECTAEQVQARAKERGGKPGYDGHCRDRGLEPGPGRAVRFRTPDTGETAFDDLIRGRVEFANIDLEDFVILRSNGTPTFLLANAVDDADMGITHIVRGEEHVNGTPKVLLLRDALGAPGDRPVFAHLPLLVNEKRQKLSKRRDDVAVEDYRDRGFLPEALRNYLATLGWGPPDAVEIRPIEEIVALFRLEDVTKSSAFFDVKKLEHFNGEYIRSLPVPTFVRLATPWLTLDSPWPPERYDPAVFERMAALVQERVSVLSQAPAMVDFLFLDEPVTDEASWDKAMKAPAAEVLADVVRAYGDAEWNAEALHRRLLEVGESHGLKLNKAQAPVRVAVTGRTVGPPLFESLEVLGRETTLARLEAARARLG